MNALQLAILGVLLAVTIAQTPSPVDQDTSAPIGGTPAPVTSKPGPTPEPDDSTPEPTSVPVQVDTAAPGGENTPVPPEAVRGVRITISGEFNSFNVAIFVGDVATLLDVGRDSVVVTDTRAGSIVVEMYFVGVAGSTSVELADRFVSTSKLQNFFSSKYTVVSVSAVDLMTIPTTPWPPTPAPTPSPITDDSDDGMSAGVIIAIVVGCIGGAIVLGLIVYCIKRSVTSSSGTGDAGKGEPPAPGYPSQGGPGGFQTIPQNENV